MNTLKQKYDCIVVGGGISGISFAHYLHCVGKKVIILEKENRMGGQIQTGFSQDGHFWYELGSHTCYNSYVSLLSLAKDIHFTDNIQVLKKDSYRLYTKENQLRNIFSEISFLSMALHIPKFFFLSKAGKTVKEYYSKLFGEKEYNRLFSKLFRAVLVQNADDYPAELLLKKRKIRWKEFPKKYTFQQGISSLLEAIVARDGFNVQKSCEVIRIERLQDNNNIPFYEVYAASGEKYTSESLAIAIPPQSAALLLPESEHALAAQLVSVQTCHSESLSVIVEKEKIPVPKMAGIICLSDDFLSAVSRDLVEHPALRSFTFHFAAGAKTEDEKQEIICRALHIKPSDAINWMQTSHILPSLHVSNLKMKEKVKTSRIDENLYILGNYFNGVSLEDCISRSREEFNRLIH